MKKKASTLTVVLALLLVTSAIPFYIESVDAVTVPHLNPDPLILTIDTPNNSRVYSPNLEITLQFTICNDIGASVLYKLSPSTGWFLYSIDDNQKLTANPNVISRVVSTVTSHHGGPTQHETTKYNVTIDLQTSSVGLHKITAYGSIAVFLGSNPMFGDGVDYRPFDPLYLIINGLSNTQVTSPSPISPTKSSNPLSIDPSSNLNSPSTTPTTSYTQSLASDSRLNQTFFAALLSTTGIIAVILPFAFYLKKSKRT